MILVLLFAWFFQNSTATNPSPQSQFIVELTDEQNQKLVDALGDMSFELDRIHSSAHYYRLHIFEDFNVERLNDLRNARILTRWQYDRPVHQRKTPNDPLFSDQWGMQKIGMVQAWDHATGGVTVNGDTIVVAILDLGFSVTHDDLQGNIWVNKAETPGDGIDNDGNGYIDDYRGVNIRDGNDAHPVDVHGAAVAGIIGARGNNGKGISGVNWNVKLLFISDVRNESDIIEGYSYCLDLRQKYESSGGTEGAYIVATNLSAGIDNGRPADFPMWCEQYDRLGEAGILGICSTTNGNTNVDEEGDMPTTCTSDYLIAVTNTDIDDEKLLFAGFGAMHIDLSAPGTPTLTCELGNGFDDFEGTSAAAPHVAGAVALLYAAACDEVLNLGSSDPGALALQMKNLLLQNVDPVSGLANITLSGGRLNVAKSVGAMVDICNISGGELEIIGISPNPMFDESLLEFNIPDLNPYEIHVYDAAGRLIFKEEFSTTIPGYQSFALDSPSLVPGLYFVSILHRDDVVTASVLVQ